MADNNRTMKYDALSPSALRALNLQLCESATNKQFISMDYSATETVISITGENADKLAEACILYMRDELQKEPLEYKEKNLTACGVVIPYIEEKFALGELDREVEAQKAEKDLSDQIPAVDAKDKGTLESLYDTIAGWLGFGK